MWKNVITLVLLFHTPDGRYESTLYWDLCTHKVNKCLLGSSLDLRQGCKMLQFPISCRKGEKMLKRHISGMIVYQNGGRNGQDSCGKASED